MKDRRGVSPAEWDADDRGGGLAVDAKFSEQGFAHGLALWRGAGLDDLDDSVADLDQVGVVWIVGGGFDEEGQLVAPVAELSDLFGVLLDAAGDRVAIDLVVLVLAEVPVDDGLLGREWAMRSRRFASSSLGDPV